jgi:hypothetical protein
MNRRNLDETNILSSSYAEYIVAKKTDLKDVLIKVGIVLAGLILAVVLLIITLKTVPTASFLILVFLVGLCGYALSFTKIEYEYIIVQGELEVVKIFGKKKRKKILDLKFTEIEKIAPRASFDASIKGMTIKKTTAACTKLSDDGVYGVLYMEKGDQKSVIYLNVIKRTLDTFKYYKRSIVEIDPKSLER